MLGFNVGISHQNPKHRQHPLRIPREALGRTARRCRFYPHGGAWPETRSWVHDAAGGQRDEGDPPSHLSGDNFQRDNALDAFSGGVIIPVWG